MQKRRYFQLVQHLKFLVIEIKLELISVLKSPDLFLLLFHLFPLLLGHGLLFLLVIALVRFHGLHCPLLLLCLLPFVDILPHLLAEGCLEGGQQWLAALDERNVVLVLLDASLLLPQLEYLVAVAEEARLVEAGRFNLVVRLVSLIIKLRPFHHRLFEVLNQLRVLGLVDTSRE